MTSIDWVTPLLPTAIRVGLAGLLPETACRRDRPWRAAILGAQFPGLEIECEHGYFDSGPPTETGEAVLGRVRAFRPHILCLAMGIPRQEHWIEDHLDRSEARVVLNLGGFMDLLTGELPMPPRWALRVRLERLVRLVSRPRRIWLRYLCEPWFLLPLLARDVRSRFTR